MTRLLLAATALGTLTGLLLTFGTGGAVGVAVCAGAVIAWYGVRAVRRDARRERDKARHPSTLGNIYISVEPDIDVEPIIRARQLLQHQRHIKGDN